MSTQPVSPRSLTRQQVRDLEANLREERSDAFEELGDEHPEQLEAMTNAIDEIISTFEANVENAVEEAQREAALALESIVEKYGYDVVKSYTEDTIGGTADVDATLDLDEEIENL